MKYKLSLVAIGLLALNLNAGGVNDVGCENKKYCTVDTLEKDTTFKDKDILISGIHSVNNIIGVDSIVNADRSTSLNIGKLDMSTTATTPATSTVTTESRVTFDGVNDAYSNININELNIKNTTFQAYKTNLTVQNATFTNSYIDRDSSHGFIRFNYLTLDNTELKHKLGSSNSYINHLNLKNNSFVNMMSGTLTIKDFTSTNTASSQADIQQTGGSLEFNGGVVDKGKIATSGGQIWLKNTVTLNGTEVKRNTADHTTHNIVIDENANATLVDTKLENLSINAASSSNKNGHFTIKGGTLTNTGIGTWTDGNKTTNLAYLTLDDVKVDNGTMQGDSIIAQNINLDNFKTATSLTADIKAKDVLNINSSDLSSFIKNISSNVVNVNGTSKTAGKFTTTTFNANSGTIGGTITTTNLNSQSGSTFDTATITAANSVLNGSTFNAGSTLTTQLLNDTGSTFNGKVTLDCTGASCGTTNPLLSVANGSTFADLTLNNDAKLLLDKGSSVTNLTLSSDKNYVAINGDSKVTGTISNEGVIEVFQGTVSTNISGTGDLITHGATYTGEVNLSDVIGSGSTFTSTVKATDSMKVHNGTFESTVNVVNNTSNNATLYAYQGNTFKADVIADNAILSYDATKDVSKGKKITLDTSLTTNNALTIKDLTVTAGALKSNTANISNATISSKLVGKDDTSTKVYESGVLSGNHTITNSDITGGIRVDELNISGSKIKSQVAVNTLNATNNIFYVFGGGLDTSFYTDYSGAIIVRKSAVGSGNTIQLSNTNLGLLTKGYVPIAIVKNEAVANTQPTPPANGGGNGGGASPIISVANPSKVAGGGISKDFFKVAYKTKIADYELADQFLTYQEKDGRYVWSVGVAGKNMVDVASVDNIVNGIDTTNIANGAKETAKVDYNKIIVDIGDMFNFKGFDQTAVESAKFIVASPEYLARTKLDIPYNRYKVFKSNHKDNGIWMNNKNGYNKYKNSSIHHTDINVGLDKVTEISNSSLMLGLAINLSSSSTKGNVISDATSKGVGIYAMNKFDNNAFIGLETFYHNIDTTYEAESLGVNTSKHHNVYTASIIAGQRLGEKVYVEPSLKYDMITYKPSKIDGEGVSIEGDRQIIHTLGVNVEVGTNIVDKLDAYIALGYAKELTDKEDLHIKDEVKPHTVKGEKGDDSIRANLGLNYNLTPKATLNADFGYNKYSNQGKEYKTNVGFAYRF